MKFIVRFWNGETSEIDIIQDLKGCLTLFSPNDKHSKYIKTRKYLFLRKLSSVHC